MWVTGVAAAIELSGMGGACGVSTAASPRETRVATTSSTAPTAASEMQVEFLGITEFSGEATDRSGLNAELEDQSPANRLGGFSAMEYTGEDDRFVLLADRGAGDGAVSFPCRMHFVDLLLPKSSLLRPNDSPSIETRFIATNLLTAPDAKQLNGSAATSIVDRSQTEGQTWHAMDPEGIRRWRDGFLISDEYGPHVGTFDLAGQMQREWKLPPSRSYGIIPADHIAGTPLAGCFDNKGLEGLAVTPSQRTVWVSFQSSLLQDGELDGDKCRGDFVRWIAFDSDGKTVREVAYPLENHRSGISELLAIDEHRLLVLERDSEFGDDAKIKQIFVANTRHASDVSGVESLPTNKAELPTRTGATRPVEKRLLIDLMQWEDELGDAARSEKPEGLAWGRPLQDGRQTLWVCWDNDFEPQRRSFIACFAVDVTDSNFAGDQR